jgi:hypothetical protein
MPQVKRDMFQVRRNMDDLSAKWRRIPQARLIPQETNSWNDLQAF